MEGCQNVKLQKIKQDLTKLSDEISTTIDFLSYLRQYSKESVTKLSEIALAPKNSEGFSRVHSFLNKYLDLIEDVNWKFQVLEVESECKDFKFYSKLGEKEDLYERQKVSNYELEVHEPPQKPFEPVINKTFEKSLIDLSSNSSDCEIEEKESNLLSFKKSNTEYKGLPLPISPVKKHKDKEFEKKELVNNSKVEDKGVYKKDLVITEEEQMENFSTNVDYYYYEIPNLKISREPNKVYNGCVETVVSPGEFYVYFLVKDIDQIQVMKNVLASRSSKYHQKQVYQEQDISEVDRKKLAIDCIGEYGLWFDVCEKSFLRVKITDWRLTEGDDLVSIFLIDYGDSKCVSLNSLQPMDNDLRKFPVFVQKCHLAGVYPLESRSGLPMVKWPKESCEMFKILLEASDLYRIMIAEHDGCYLPDSIPVQLHAADSDKTINEALVDYEYAKYLKTPPAALPYVKTPPKKSTSPPVFKSKSDARGKTAPAPDFTGKTATAPNEEKAIVPVIPNDWDPRKEDYESHRNTYDLDVDDPASAIYGYVQKDYERICYQFGTTGKCYKGDNCRKEHKLFDPDGFTTDQEPIYIVAKNPLQPPAVGEEFPVEVTLITSVNSFFCQRLMEEFEAQHEETLASLNQYINELENVANLKKLSIPPALGEIVLGEFYVDSLWYRARVVDSYPEKDEYHLFFVDYGNSAVVDLSKIRKIEPKYLHLPFQAIKCELLDVQPNPEVSKKDALEYFKRIVEESTMLVKVVHVLKGESFSLVVKLFDMNCKDIGRDLITKKIAVHRQTLLFKDDNKYFPA